MRILQKKISGNQYPFCLAQSSKSLDWHSLQSASTKFSCWTVGLPQSHLCFCTDLFNDILFCLHSNHLKATSLINVYEEISPQRRYNPLSYFEWYFESSENKAYENPIMATHKMGDMKNG